MNIIISQIIPINRSHVDTDQIIPAEFLRSTSREGYGKHLFSALRRMDTDFPLNLERYRGAKILVAGTNFGCGSSREHAVWALADWGIQAIIAPSFADIFFQNALNNGILPIVLPEQIVERVFSSEAGKSSYEITVDLPKQTVIVPEGEIYLFSIDPYRKECLMQGVDDFDYLLAKHAEIEAFEQIHRSFRYFNTFAVKGLIDKGGHHA